MNSLQIGCRSADPSLYPRRIGDVPGEVILLDNHWHSAPIFRSKDLPADLRQQLGPAGNCPYVAIGWGDEGFFRAERITPGLIAQALFYSRGSVLLVVGLEKEPEASFAPGVDVYRLPTRPQSVRRMVEAVSNAFRRVDGRIVDAGPGIDGGRFYRAEGRYAFYHTCNQWAADVLAAGGLPISAAYASLSSNVASQVRRLPGVRRNGEPLPPTPEFVPLSLRPVVFIRRTHP